MGILLPGEHQFLDFLAQFANDCFNLDEFPGSKPVQDRLNSSKSLQTRIDQRRSKATKIIVSNGCPLCERSSRERWILSSGPSPPIGMARLRYATVERHVRMHAQPTICIPRKNQGGP